MYFGRLFSNPAPFCYRTYTILRFSSNSLFGRYDRTLTASRCRSYTSSFKSTISDVKEARIETDDVTALDELLVKVRSRSNPAFRSIMPMKSKRSWAELLLDASHDQAPLDPRLHRPTLDQSELPPRHMHESYSQLEIPFLSSPETLDQYVNSWGGIRTGKLMEHLDSLAGSIAYKHMLGPSVETIGKVREHGYYIVTAAVDRLDMLAPLQPIRDVRLSGHVIYTGRSSMEIVVKMEALNNQGVDETLMIGRFSMVCRDALTHKARPVNPLVASSPEEEALITIGESHKAKKKILTQRSLSRVPPSSDESQALHDLYLSTTQLEKVKSPNIVAGETEWIWMADTKLEKALLMFPQERNIHQKVFGGYLMRLAYELGFTTASVFSHKRHLHFLSLDGIWFERPVPIGSVLRLTSQVTHTNNKEFSAVVHVFVQARVVDVVTGKEEHTNDFKFTWGETDPGNSPLCRSVVPQTYAESMAWIEGHRALSYGAKIRRLRRSNS